MKTHHLLRHSVLSHLAAVAGLGLLSHASAAQKHEPVYSDIPGLTAPPGTPGTQQAPAAAPVPVMATPAPIFAPAPIVVTPAPVVLNPPPPLPPEDDTKNK